jgi:hypothetical protein
MNLRADRRLLVFVLLLLAAGWVTATGVGARVAQHAPAALDVQPFPGTPDASPQTDVSFAAVAPSQLRSVAVKGSRSGWHTGSMAALAGGHGTVFEPSKPFVDGDRVSVSAALRSGQQINFTFDVAASRPVATKANADTYVIRHDIRDKSTWTHSFHSESTLHPPLAWMDGKDLDPKASGLIFTDAHRVYLQAGPIILDPFGKLVWFDPLPNQQAGFNTQAQRYQGQQVLTFWQGYVAGGVGNGYDVIMDHHYNTVKTVHAGNGLQADLHEFLITPQGNAFITAYAPVQADLRSVGGSSTGTLLDSIIQEVNIRTGQVLFEWHAYGHVHLNESHAGKPNSHPYDFFHINSIQPLSNGNLLVSARNTWALYEINMRTGKIPLVIGGRHSSFKIGPGANFSWQHDARMQPDGSLTLFDNGYGYTKQEKQSRALRLSLGFKAHTLSLLHAYTNNPPLLSQSQGSVQPLGDHYTFVGWGNAPYVSEFDPQGKWDFSVHFHSPTQLYRGFRYGWWGQPSVPPDVAASATSKGTTVYAAWNGATLVAKWRVLAGSSTDVSKMRPVGTFPVKGFETAMAVRSTQAYFAVQALGSGGGVRGTSKAAPR